MSQEATEVSMSHRHMGQIEASIFYAMVLALGDRRRRIAHATVCFTGVERCLWFLFFMSVWVFRFERTAIILHFNGACSTHCEDTLMFYRHCSRMHCCAKHSTYRDL